MPLSCQFKAKLANKRLKTMAPQYKEQASEIIEVPADVQEVRCDGGNGPLGHPVVWYSFDGRDRAECYYCDRLFLKKPL